MVRDRGTPPTGGGRLVAIARFWSRRAVVIAAVSAATAAGLTGVTSVMTPMIAQAAGDVAMYRLYNPATGEHFFTSDLNEAMVSVAQNGWDSEGIGWWAPPSGTGSPVYRLGAKPGTGSAGHLYTTSSAERTAVLNSGQWNDEGIGWYSAGSVGVYRQFNPATGQHNYTSDQNEIKVLTTQQGWVAELNGNPAWYAMAAGNPSDRTVINAVAAFRPSGSGPTTKTLAMVPVHQEQTNWCWAASAQMIQLAVRGVAPSQCSIVTSTLGRPTCDNVGVSDLWVSYALIVLGLSYTTNYPGLPGAATIKAQVDAGKPLEYDFALTAGGKHVVVIKGYYYDPASPTGSTIYWNDPWEPSSKQGSWSYLSSNSTWQASFAIYGIS